jgi:hypothetical protein
MRPTRLAPRAFRPPTLLPPQARDAPSFPLAFEAEYTFTLPYVQVVQSGGLRWAWVSWGLGGWGFGARRGGRPEQATSTGRGISLSAAASMAPAL